jgi:hypothetical protein
LINPFAFMLIQDGREGEYPAANSSLQLPYKLEIPLYRDAFISAFKHGFTPGPDADALRVEICCGTWMTMACVQATSTGGNLLSDALLASRLHSLGQVRQDRSLTQMGLQLQVKALNGLRIALANYSRKESGQQGGGSDLFILSTVALACAMAELLCNKSWERFAQHLGGVGALIQLAGPVALADPSARTHYLGYRAVNLAFSYINRKDSFLSDPKWVQFPGRDEDSIANSPIHILLDIAYRIPMEMEAFDCRPIATADSLFRQLERLMEIRGGLETWEQQLPTIAIAPMDIDTANGGVAEYTKKCKFQDADTANYFTIYVGVRIGLIDILLQVAQNLAASDPQYDELIEYTVSEGIRWSVIVCQCLNYFKESESFAAGKLICLFPFDMAWKMMAKIQLQRGLDLAEHLVWFHQRADEIAETGLPVLVER